MKKISLSIFAILLGLVSYSQNIIHYWSFNTGASSVTDSAWYIPASPDSTLASPDTGKITHNVAHTEDFSGSTTNAPSGVSSGSAFVLRNNANNGKMITFHVPSKNKAVKEFTFAAKRTSSGFDTLEIAYSTNGTTFTSHPVSEIHPTSSWVTYKVALDTITGVDSNSNLKIRITIKGASSSSGNTRLDNVTLTQKSSTPPPPPKPISHYAIGAVTTVNSTTGVLDSLNVKCFISGVVYGVDMAGTSSTNNSFTIIDATGGIGLFKFSGFTPSYTVTEGDSITLWGSVSQYNGLAQFSADSLKKHKGGAALKPMMKVTSLGESTESELVRIDSVTIVNAAQWPSAGSNANVEIKTLAGDTLIMRIDRDTDVDDSISTAPVGFFNIAGLGGQFDSSNPYLSGYQILPRYKSDVMGSSSPPPPPAAIPHYGLGMVTTEDTNGVADSANVKCSVSGVVQGIDMSGLSSSSNTFQLFDATGHVTVYKSRGFTPSYTVNESDSVTLYGKVTQYNGLTQFTPDSIKIHKTGAALKMMRKVSMLNESTESDFIRIDSVRLVDPSKWPTMGNQTNLDIITQAGDTLVLRIDKDSYVDDSVTAPAGMFDVIGYGGQFDGSSPYTSGYQILPQLKNHIRPYAAATCNAPDSLDVQNVTNVSAELKWKTGGSTTWNVEYGAKGFTPGSGTKMTVTVNPYMLSGLMASTDYDFYVQDSCVGLGVSAWSSVKSFKTTAGPKPIPFYKIKDIRGLDANGEPDSIDVECWISGTVFTADFDGNNGYTFGMMDDTRGITVHSFVDVNNYVVKDGDTLKMKGKVKFYNGLTQFRVDSIVRLDSNKMYKMPMMVTKFDETTESEYIEVRKVYVADTSQWPSAGNNSNVDIVTPAGDTLIMRIDRDTDVDDMWPMAPDTFTVRGIGSQFDPSSPYFDGYQIFPRWFMDIDTNKQLPCKEPIALKNTNVTVSSASISWTSPGTTWNIGWSLNHTSTSADIIDSVMGITTNPYVITGLNQNQHYHVYVQEVCGMDHSKWSDPTMFTTLATGLDDINGNKASLIAFPNPNNIGEVRFNMEVSVTVRNILGQTVKSAKEVLSLDISDLNSGVYLIQSEEGDTIRFIVE